MWPKNRYVIHLAGKFALFVSGIIQPLSKGFFLKKKKKIGAVGGGGVGGGGHFLSEKASGTRF